MDSLSIRQNALAMLEMHAAKPLGRSSRASEDAMRILQEREREFRVRAPEKQVPKTRMEPPVAESDSGLLRTATEFLVYNRTREVQARPVTRQVLGNYVDLTA